MILQKLSLSRRNGRGFTLVELAIVLAVASLLFAGLWRLMAGGNTQLRDQAAADQQKQVLSAVKSLLATQKGQDKFDTHTQDEAFDLPILDLDLAAFLPAGFQNSNSYGQAYSIRLKGHWDAYVLNSNPTSYSFMVLTTAGTNIPDTSGGRISSMIGGDGGFIYSTDVCGAPANRACGAYGGWRVDDVTAAGPAGGYGFAASASGHMASRSSSGSESTFNESWLARKQLAPVDDFNTMQANMYFTGPNPVGVIPTGTDLYMQGSTINLNKGVINGGYSTTGSPIAGYSLDKLGKVFISLGSGASGTSVDTALTVWSAGPKTHNATDTGLSVTSPNTFCQRGGPADSYCPNALTIQGDVTMQNSLMANVLYAGSFVYSQGSDMRLKYDIKPIDKALEKLGKVRGLEFKMKQNNEEKLGVLAQEVETVFPQIVSGKGDGIRGIDYTGLIGPIIAAVNELKSENDALRVQVNEQAVAIKKLQSVGQKK